VKRRLFALGAVLLTSGHSGCIPYTPSTANYPSDWNPKQIEWQPYALGLRAAAREHKPIVLVFYTDWCPHCHNYSRVFHDPRVVEASGAFVMIRVDNDGNPELSMEYALDGNYIPRTFFLLPSGEVLEQVRPERPARTDGGPEFRYLVDEYEPDELLELMHEARELAKAQR